MKQLIGLLILPILISSCDTSGVENVSSDPADDVVLKDSVNILNEVNEVVDEKKLKNGIIIKWFAHGNGGEFGSGDCINIDYQVLLEDKTLVDANQLNNKSSVPFMVGFNMQTPGWELAMKELKIGDFVQIFIPSALARGEKGIKDLIPPNANNILKLRVLSKREPTREVDGNKVWIFEENDKNKLKFNEENEIEFHCMVGSPSNPRYVDTYRSNNPFRMKLEDSGTVPGLKKALINAKKSDRMFIYVPAVEAYGEKGYQDVVKPNEALFYNVLVMDIIDK